MVNKRKGSKTRRRLLEVAFGVIHRKGFQAAGLNEILEQAGLTKGAMYYHFGGKNALGYAVVEEIVGELIHERWIAPLVSAEGDALTKIPRVMRSAAEEMDESDIALGCPLGNLAAEMSALDDGFAQRIDAIYQRWRDALAAAIVAGKADDDPQRIATFVVAAISGSLAQAKVLARRDILLNGITELEFFLHQSRTAAAKPPASEPPTEPPEPEPDSEPETTYAPPPAEMEDYLL
ncbi:MAG: TetR/AcrR family transcriptional regulator [Phycisphaerae bacterium]|jgi:AcrR family transcriptional regulator|nr:TetR/AcrR family transcriptional regulator [Phycisphaerae bacterium]